MRVKYILFVLGVSLVASCSPFTPVNTPPQNMYLLKYNNSLENKNTHKTKILLITQPEAPEWLNTNKMLYKTAGNKINYFAQNQWVSTPAEMLRVIMTKALFQSGSGSVTERLDIQLMNMEQDFSQNPSVFKFEVQAELINMTTGNIIRTQRFNYEIPAVSNNPEGGVNAANKAVQLWIPQLIDFCRRSPANI